MKSIRWFLLGAFLATAPACMGQRGSNWRVYKAADGLPETFTTSVTVGPHGHLWVRHPSMDWVGWLDGYEVEAIPSPGEGSSPVYESASGQLWSYTPDGLKQYKSKEEGWLHFDTPEVTEDLRKNNANLIRPVPICPMKQNHVLLLTPDGLMECDTDDPAHPKTTLVHAATQTGLQKFSGMTPARDGGLWVVGARGLAKLTRPIRNLKPETEWQEHPVPESLHIRNLREPMEDDEGGVTALAEPEDGNGQVVAYFNGKEWTAESTAGERFLAAWRGNKETEWAINFNSLFQRKPGQKQFTPNEEFSQRHFFDVALETNGIFWLATSDGLFRYAPLAWRTPENASGLNSNILALGEDQAGSTWAATETSLHVLANEHWTNYAFPPELSADAHDIRALFALTNGMIVLETGDGCIQFNSRTGKFDSATGGELHLKPLGLLKDGTLCVLETNYNQVTTAQLATYDGTNVGAFPFPQPELAAGSDPQFLFAAPSGNLWLGGSNGIAWYHDKKWQVFASPPQSVSAAPSCIVEVSDGRIWCGIQDKIMEFDGKTWTAVRAGFYRVNSMTKGRDGSIFVSSETGFHRFFHGTWTANGVEEGLPGGGVSIIVEDRSGHLWAATSRGLSLYHSDADPDPPKTHAQDLTSPNNTAKEGTIVTVSFSGEDKWKYTAQDLLVYSYQLDGQEWSPYQEQRSTSFLNLTAGKHLFRVRCMDRNWNVDPTPALLQFVIAVPWYRESRFVFILGVGLAVTIFFAGLAFNRHRQLVKSYAEVEAKVALRTQQLERANQELFHSQKMNALGTLAAGIAHDFNNILSIIKGSAQIIEDNVDNEAKIRTRTERIKTVVEQGAGIVNAMLGFSRSSDRHLTPCNLNTIVQNTITLLGDRFLREVEVQFKPGDAALPEVPASKDFIQQILLNFIFNAAEASTGRKQIILSVTQFGELPASLALKPARAASYIFVSAKDFGSGIAPEIMPRIFEPFFTTKSLSTRRGTGLGLSMVYELAQQMDCGLSVESVVGKGSTFTLIIPVRDLSVETPEEKKKTA